MFMTDGRTDDVHRVPTAQVSKKKKGGGGGFHTYKIAVSKYSKSITGIIQLKKEKKRGGGVDWNQQPSKRNRS